MLRKITKYLFRAVVLLISLLLTYLLVGIILSVIPANRDSGSDTIYDPDKTNNPDKKNVEIYITSNGVHTDFLLPVRNAVIDWSYIHPYEDFRNIDASYKYICFGWGDRKFFIETPNWADLTFGTAFNALFLRSESAVHVTYIYNPAGFDIKRKMMISEARYGKLTEYIKASFQHDSFGRVILIPDTGYGSNDAFYEGAGSYSFINTCNEWTGSGLRRVGVETGVWTPFAQSVLYHLEE